MADHPLHTALFQALDDIGEMCPGGRRCSHSATAALRAVVERHYPVDCAGALCSEQRWCAGCDPEGTRSCVEAPWPCRDVQAVARELDVSVEGVAAGHQKEGTDHG